MATSTDYTDIPKKAFFRPDEVAVMFGVTVKTVRNWKAEGKLEGINKTGRCLIFPRRELVRFVLSEESS